MTKGKPFPSLIAKASARKAAFKRRKQALIKKMSELSTLCDVPAFLIIFWQGQAEIWSSTPDPLEVLRRFISLPHAFLERELKKLEDKIQKLELENSEREVKLLLYRTLRGDPNLDGISPEAVIKLSSIIEEKIAQVKERITTIKTEMLLNDSPDEDTNLPSIGGDTESPSDDHSSG